MWGEPYLWFPGKQMVMSQVACLLRTRHGRGAAHSPRSPLTLLCEQAPTWVSTGCCCCCCPCDAAAAAAAVAVPAAAAAAADVAERLEVDLAGAPLAGRGPPARDAGG